MNPLIFMIAAAVAPLLLALFLRVGSVYFFASVLAGGILTEYLSDDVTLTLNTFLKDKDPLTVVHIVLLLLPVGLTLIFLRKTLKVSKFLLELISLVATTAMLIVLLLPQLPNDVQTQVTSTPSGNIVHKSTDVVIGAGILINMAFMWLLNKKRHEEGHHGKHGKHH